MIPGLPYRDRVTLRCACKIREARTGRYRAGETRQLSSGAALIEVHGSLAAAVGDPVDLVIDRGGDRHLVERREMVRALITRLERRGNVCLLAVRFARPLAQTAAA